MWFSMLKKFFKSWQVCDWLPKWLIMLGFMDLRQPRRVRRSNVGLVLKLPLTCYLCEGSQWSPLWGKTMILCITYSYKADKYITWTMNLAVHCLRKVAKFDHSRTGNCYFLNKNRYKSFHKCVWNRCGNSYGYIIICRFVQLEYRITTPRDLRLK